MSAPEVANRSLVRLAPPMAKVLAAFSSRRTRQCHGSGAASDLGSVATRQEQSIGVGRSQTWLPASAPKTPPLYHRLPPRVLPPGRLLLVFPV